MNVLHSLVCWGHPVSASAGLFRVLVWNQDWEGQQALVLGADAVERCGNRTYACMCL